MKKFLFSTLLITAMLIAFSAVVYADGYVFTAQEAFPVPYSSSIEVVNEDHGIYRADSIEEIQYLIDAGIVTYYEEEIYYTLFDYTVSDPYYEQYQEAYLTQVFTQFAWERNVFGNEVKIAIIDSGLYEAASDFNTNKVVRAYDYTDTASNKGNYYCKDENGHGTMVAGIIAAQHNTRGITGIAPNSSLYIFKCFDADRNGKNTNITDAIYKAVDEYGVDIINMSFGGKSSTVFKEAVNYAVSKGVLIVAAAGNDGSATSNVYYPASYDNVISVGSVASNGHRASHSQRNDYVNVLAPGEEIFSTTVGGYGTSTGTSFATPHVVAAAALAKSINPSLTNYELQDIIYTTCDAITDQYSGFGVLNIQALLTYVKATTENNLFYSTNGRTVYLALMVQDGYTAYFALYDDNMLTSVFTTDGNTYIICDKTYLNSFRIFVWDENLSPYGIIEKKEY